MKSNNRIYDRNYEMMKYKTEEEQLKAVIQDGYSIRYISNPSEKIQLAAMKKKLDGDQIY